jgi:vacuolar-type H+-ATPase subunit E/Vma4
MTEQRLKVESGPPEHVVSEAHDRAAASPPHAEQPATEGAKDKMQEAAADAKDKAQEAAAPAKEKARDIAGQAKAHAQAAADQAKGRAAAQVDERSTQIGQQIGTQAQSLDGVAEELRSQGKDGPAKLAQQAGERVRSVGSYLEQTDGESLVQAAADAARENPAAAAAVGAAAGFAAGRLLKASLADDSPEGDEAVHPGDEGGSS